MRQLIPLCLLALVLFLAAGCSFQDSDRDESLMTLARWEDRRLADNDSLTAFIRSDDAHIRMSAVRAAGLIGRDEILPVLIEALADRSQTVAAEAAFAIGLTGGEQGIDALTEAIETGGKSLRRAAIEGLAQLPGDGAALFGPALGEDSIDALKAWNALRMHAAEADSSRMIGAIRAGLSRTENEVLWRVLRCAERRPDSTLVAQIAPFTKHRDTQVRVHAFRALSNHAGREALLAVLDGAEHESRLSGRDAERVQIAWLRALGALAEPALTEPESDAINSIAARVTTLLTAGAGNPSHHVARTALAAMSAATANLDLPPLAAERESLLPVWRIRMARAAEKRLDDAGCAVRASAVTACGRLRHAGAVDVWTEALADSSRQVRETALATLAEYSTSLDDFMTALQLAAPGAGSIRPAAVTALAQLHHRADGLVPTDSTTTIGDISALTLAALTTAAMDTDFVLATTTVALIADFDSPLAGQAMLAAWNTGDKTDGSGNVEWNDVRLAVLDGIETLFADSTRTDPGADLRAEAASLLGEAFDAADIRLRLRAREVALASGLIPVSLVPGAASLRATLPPVTRHAAQPAVCLPGDAPKVRCRTQAGDFIIQLNAGIAPNTVANFLHLVREGDYEGLSFHRVVPDFVVQGGCPRGDGWGGPGYCIRSEWSRSNYDRAAVGIAHSGKDTGGSQFFVTLSSQPHLDARYTIFGEVSEGMDVVDTIAQGDTFSLEIIEE